MNTYIIITKDAYDNWDTETVYASKIKITDGALVLLRYTPTGKYDPFRFYASGFWSQCFQEDND